MVGATLLIIGVLEIRLGATGLVMPGGGPAVFVIGLGMLGCGIAAIVMRKKEYVLLLASASTETTGVQSTDCSLVSGLCEAIKQAISSRG